MRELLSYLRPPDRRAGLILLTAAIVPVLYVYNGTAEFYLAQVAPLLGLEDHPLADVHARLYQFSAVFVLFFLAPTLLTRLVLGEGPSRFGWCVGDWRFGLKFTLIATLVALPFIYVSAGQADFQAEYPLSKQAAADPVRFLLYEGAYLLYYVGWESLFRGTMLFGLRERYGSWGAIAFQCFPSILIHIGKPVGETWASVAAGFLLGAVALRTGSILYVLAFHYAMGILNDVFCAMRAGLF